VGMRFASIVATGRCVPERVVTNAELEARLGEPVDQWLVANVGIRERHVMADGETTSDLAARAGRRRGRPGSSSPAGSPPTSTPSAGRRWCAR
jgi:3-oxoacyl-[acyl-carrier-protein] synthase III